MAGLARDLGQQLRSFIHDQRALHPHVQTPPEVLQLQAGLAQMLLLVNMMEDELSGIPILNRFLSAAGLQTAQVIGATVLQDLTALQYDTQTNDDAERVARELQQMKEECGQWSSFAAAWWCRNKTGTVKAAERVLEAANMLLSHAAQVMQSPQLDTLSVALSSVRPLVFDLEMQQQNRLLEGNHQYEPAGQTEGH